jgi:hypothetical protein
MTKIKLTINGSEYFPIKSVALGNSLNKSISIRSATVSAIYSIKLKDFLLELNQSKILLCNLFIDDKLFLQGFINDKLVHYGDSSDGGTNISIRLLDRFVGLVGSDIIYSRPDGQSLQSFMSDILTELGYLSSTFKNTYLKKINSARDFLSVRGNIDINKPLKAPKRNSLVEEQSFALLGECLSINKVILMSNGYDTLTFEKPNISGAPTFEAFRHLSSDRYSNIVSLEKYGEMGDANSMTPSIIITLNSSSDSTKKDKNTSVISANPNGIPHIIKVHRVDMNASYQEISGMMNFAFAGIRARSNSFIIRLGNIKFDKNGDFFQPNRTITVYDEKYGHNFNMIIMDARTDIDADSGSQTTLNVSFSESFEDNISIKQKGKILR